MKILKLALVATSVLFCSNSFGQKTLSPAISGVNESTENNINNESSISEEKSISEQIALIDEHLNAIQQKWDYIMSNQELIEQAEKSDWFKQMSAVKEQLLAQKKQLMEKLNDKN